MQNLTAPDDEHPIFKPGRIVGQLSSDALLGIVDAARIHSKRDGWAYYDFGHGDADIVEKALGWYQNHHTDLDALGAKLIEADRGSAADRYAGALNETTDAFSSGGVGRTSEEDPQTRRAEPLRLVYGRTT